MNFVYTLRHSILHRNRGLLQHGNIRQCVSKVFGRTCLKNTKKLEITIWVFSGRLQRTHISKIRILDNILSSAIITSPIIRSDLTTYLMENFSGSVSLRRTIIIRWPSLVSPGSTAMFLNNFQSITLMIFWRYLFIINFSIYVRINKYCNFCRN